MDVTSYERIMYFSIVKNGEIDPSQFLLHVPTAKAAPSYAFQNRFANAISVVPGVRKSSPVLGRFDVYAMKNGRTESGPSVLLTLLGRKTIRYRYEF